MKKKIAAAILTATLLIAGCESVNVSAQDDTMEEVEFTSEYSIYVDKDTGVMYLFMDHGAYRGGLTVMLNADGTPKIWNGEE